MLNPNNLHYNSITERNKSVTLITDPVSACTLGLLRGGH